MAAREASRLILVRHSLPEIDPSQPASRWGLSAEGHARSRALAPRLANWEPRAVYSSPEPKALQTAGHIAAYFELAVSPVPGLEEHHRETTAFTSKKLFEASVAELYARPSECVFGEESGEQALGRFTQAVEALISRHAGESIVVVTHGTVLSLWAASQLGVGAMAFWRRLTLPYLLVVALPQYQVLADIREMM